MNSSRPQSVPALDRDRLSSTHSLFATQLDTKLDSQHVRDPSQRQSVCDRQQPVRDSTILARDLSNDQFQLATRSVPTRDDQQAIRSRLFFIRWSIQPDLRLR
ncbi:hypothetical protein F2Q69_00009030 [Brassica cretica]|uniref:Uncharacterized protein n=1 Tax=Brassica cretica TaxID=69181 RepID=A0A8S9P4E3_BRACR|nr:hypothetical protein F2Q69_00009030 [Brassica cretica]